MSHLRRLTIYISASALIFTANVAFAQIFPQTQPTSASREKEKTAPDEIRLGRGDYAWNGFYGGGNMGGGLGSSSLLTGTGAGLPCFECEIYPGLSNIPYTLGVLSAYRSNTATSNSVSGGVHLGYNFPVGGFLVGGEIDVDVLRVSPSKFTYAFGEPGAFGQAVYGFYSSAKSNYVATLRPRIGLPIWGAMVYVTGGVALTTIDYQHQFLGAGGILAAGGTPTALGIACCTTSNPIYENTSASIMKAGWTVGGGVEFAITSNVSLRTEYLYTDFGKVYSRSNPIYSLAAPDAPCGGTVGGFFPRQCFDHTASLSLHRVRMGVNIKF